MFFVAILMYMLFLCILVCLCWSQKAKNNPSDGHPRDTKTQECLLWKKQRWLSEALVYVVLSSLRYRETDIPIREAFPEPNRMKTQRRKTRWEVMVSLCLVTFRVWIFLEQCSPVLMVSPHRLFLVICWSNSTIIVDWLEYKGGSPSGDFTNFVQSFKTSLFL